MNDAQLLERLSSAYATLEAPTPSAALAEILESGAVGAGTDDERRDAVVVPFVRPQHTRLRMRHLVAAMVATFVLFSGLAVAGALPDPVQRQVSSVVAHLGIDLPSPDSGSSGGGGSPRTPDHQGPTPNAGAGVGTTTTVAGGGAGTPVTGGGSTPASPSTTIPGGLPLGDVGDVVDGGSATGGGTVTTLPPPSTLLPPLTVPDTLLPPITVPQVTLPPLTIPQLPLPPLPLPLPLPLGL